MVAPLEQAAWVASRAQPPLRALPPAPNPTALAVRSLVWAALVLGAAAGGPGALAALFVPVVAVASLSAARAARRAARHRPGGAVAGGVALSVVAPVAAGIGVVAAGLEGSEIVVLLLVAALLWDLANAVMGTGATGGILGAVAGAVTLAVLATIMEAVLTPPFGHDAWAVLPALVAVLAPLAVSAGGRCAPGRVPAFRRLDSLALSAPAWAVGAALLTLR